MVSGNVQCLASHISNTATITPTAIYFGKTGAGEILLTIPIKTPESAIVITLGIDSSYPNTQDYTLRIGVTDDRNNNNWFTIVDGEQYNKYPPCFPVVDDTDETRISCGTEVPSTFKFTLLPKEKLGYCETAQNGGYISIGKFHHQLDLSRSLELHLIGWNPDEEYSIYYISIQSI